MQTMKEIIDALSPQEKQQLMYAFENGFSQHVRTPGNRFVGVSVDTIQHLSIEKRAGVWAYGTVKG